MSDLSDKTPLSPLESLLCQDIVAHSPALMCIFEQGFNQQIDFKYLSPNCFRVLGITHDVLHDAPETFTGKLYLDDEKELQIQLAASAKHDTELNWEGRIWVSEWQDYKWINLRAKPILKEDNKHLWYGVMLNITASALQKEELLASKKSLAKFSLQLHTAKDEERKRISREVHDDIGGNLSAIKLGLNGLLGKLDADDAILADKVKYVLSIVDRTFESVHKIASDLRPNLLELGLVAAVFWLIEDFEKRSGIKAQLDCNVDYISLTPDQELAIFRVCQEAFSNITKYAQASEVKVLLHLDDDKVHLHIQDNGVGFMTSHQNPEKNSLGIIGMRERIRALNGTFEVVSNPKTGTSVKVSMPKKLFGKNLN